MLDLDNLPNFTDKYEQILYAKKVWSELEKDFNNCREIYNEITGAPEDIQNLLAKDLQKRCIEVLKKNCKCVVAYHACRTPDPKQYFQKGLLPSIQTQLHEQASEVFAGCSNLGDALSYADNHYKTYQGSVSMHMSARFVDEVYLEKGSHYLRMIAGQLGFDGEDQLKSYNKKALPFFVKCRIPLSWLADPAIVPRRDWLYRYNGALINRIIWAKAAGEEEYDEMRQGIIILGLQRF